MQAGSIVVCVDNSDESMRALVFACSRLFRPESRLHVVTVLPPEVHAIAPAVPIATASAVSAVTSACDAQRKADKQAANCALRNAAQRCEELGIPTSHLSFHTLPPLGGASGIAESVVKYVTDLPAGTLVMGSRGLGAFKRAMLGMLGLGSVGEYCAHKAPCTTVVVKSAATEEPSPGDAPTAFKVCVPVDDSTHSKFALDWAAAHLLRDATAELHVVSVSKPVSLPIVDESSAVLASMQSKQWSLEKEENLRSAEGVCALAIRHLKTLQCVPESQVFWKALAPEGGASDVAASIVRYCTANSISACVVGSHGFGAFTRSLRAFIGLGSVSDYCLNNARCPVCVVKVQPGGTDDDGPVEAANAVAAASSGGAPADEAVGAVTVDGANAVHEHSS